MSEHHAVTLDLPDDLLIAIGRAARDSGLSASDFVRSTLRDALRPDAGDIAQAIRRDLRLATDWADFLSRLRASGRAMRLAADGALWIHDWPLLRPLVPAAEVGLSLPALVLRFGAGFPAWDVRDIPHADRDRPVAA